MKKIITLALCLVTLMVNAALAEEEGPSSVIDREGRRRYMLPISNPDYVVVSLGEVELKNMIDDYDREKMRMNYLFIGERNYRSTDNDVVECGFYGEGRSKERLEYVLYSNGTRVDYSYMYHDGEMVTCEMKASNGVKMTVVKGIKDSENNTWIMTSDGRISMTDATQKSGQTDEDDTYFLIIEPPEGQDDDGDLPGPIIIAFRAEDGENPLDRISTTPIEQDFFHWLEDALDNLDRESEAAREEYKRNISTYYENVYSELSENSEALESESINLKAHLGGLGGAELKDEEKKILINAAVEYIRSEAEESGGDAAQEFLAVEEQLNEEFLTGGRKIYKDRIDETLKPVNALIDKILNSKLALFLNLEKDKIEIIINLPELKKKTKTK